MLVVSPGQMEGAARDAVAGHLRETVEGGGVENRTRRMPQRPGTREWRCCSMNQVVTTTWTDVGCVTRHRWAKINQE